MKRFSKHLPFVIIAGSVVLRLLGVCRPLLGNFAIYETAQAMIAKFFVETNYGTILYPQVNVLVNGKPSLLLLYYPVSSLIAACLYSIFGVSIDLWGRFQATIFFAGAAFYLYLLIKELSDRQKAIGALVAFCLLPLTVIYGQSFQNEMGTVFCSVAFLYYLKQLAQKFWWGNLIASALLFSLVLMTRPNNIYLLIPAFYMIRFNLGLPWRSKGTGMAILSILMSMVIPGLWFLHVWRVSNELNNIYSTLFAQLMVRSSFVSPLVFNPDYYRQLFDVVSGIVLTPIGFTLFIVGSFLAASKWKKDGLFLIWVLAFFLSSFLIPRKLLDHNFYFLHLLLPASFLMATGFSVLRQESKARGRQFAIFLSLFLAVSFLVSMRYAVNPSFKTPDEDKNILSMAERVKNLTKKEKDRVIVLGTHALLYYADRYGWPFVLERGDELSPYYQQMNWEKLSHEKWERRNEAYRNSITTLEYLRTEEDASYFVVSNPQAFYNDKSFSEYMRRHFRIVYEDVRVGLIFALQ